MNSDFHLHYDHDDSNDGNEDEDIKRAISNSLQTSKEESRRPIETNDDDLHKAIQLSLQSQPNKSKTKQTPTTTTTNYDSTNNKTANSTTSTTSTSTSKRNPYDSDDEDFKLALKNSLLDASHPSSSSSPTPSLSKPTSEVERPMIKWAWYLNRLPGFSKKANSPAISIQNIVKEEGLESAIVTTYELDMEWLLERVPVLGRIPVTMVHGEKNPDALPAAPANMKYHKPNLPLQWGVHHGKMFVLYYPDCVRVAITTANLILIDYERKSQGIWMQDFPKKEKDSKACNFETTLVDYVTRLGLNTAKIKEYDYTSANVVLITSVPGYHKGDLVNRYGHMKLRAALQKEKFPAIFKDASIACQFSSTGSLSKDWLLDEMMGTLCANAGFHGLDEVKTDKQKDKKELGDKKRSRETRDKLENKMELVWPTVEFVRNSLDGWSSGGSLCFPAKNLKSFFKEENLFHAYTSFHGRENVPPHIKTYSRYLPDGELAWNYLTSSNLSKAAMGELQKSGTQLMIRHYEIGVLFLPSLYDGGQGANTKFISLQGYLSSTQNTSPNSNSNAKTNTNLNLNANLNSTSNLVGIPLPYTLPPKIYGAGDEPWVWDVPRTKQDLYGRRWQC